MYLTTYLTTYLTNTLLLFSDAALTELALKETQNTESEIEIERRNHQKLIKVSGI